MANSFVEITASCSTLFVSVHALKGTLQKINDPEPSFGLLFGGSLYRIEVRAHFLVSRLISPCVNTRKYFPRSLVNVQRRVHDSRELLLAIVPSRNQPRSRWQETNTGLSSWNRRGRPRGVRSSILHARNFHGKRGSTIHSEPKFGNVTHDLQE